MEAGSIDIPNLEALRAELSNEFAQELVAVFAEAPTSAQATERLAEILAARLQAARTEQEGGSGAEDPVD